MEESIKNLSKTTTPKDSNDPSSLFDECQHQLEQLNKQLAFFLSGQRDKQMRVILPTISTLGQEIQHLKENIGYEVTQEESKKEQQSLLKIKQSLLKRIEGHSHKIQFFRKQLQILDIDKDELFRYYQKNQITTMSQVSEEIRSNIEGNSAQAQIKRNIQFGRKLLSKKSSLPSLFSKAKSLTTSRYLGQTDIINESKEEKVDKMLAKMSSLWCDSLSTRLVKLAKRESGALKSVFKGYRTNDKIEQFLRDKGVMKELIRLQRRLVR